MTVINGVPATGGVTSTVLKALTEIQMVPADIVSVTTCTSNANFYEPALQARLTSNAVYKRYVSAKVSLQSNTAGVVTVSLWDVTTGASLATTTVTITSNVNTEVALAATNVEQQVTALGNVLTIKVKHAVNGATVTLNSGGMMEADLLTDVSATGYVSTISNYLCWVSSWKYLALAGLSTASYTIQPVWSIALASTYYGNIGATSSTLNTSQTVGLTTKLMNGNTSALKLNVSALSLQILLGQAFGISADNI